MLTMQAIERHSYLCADGRHFSIGQREPTEARQKRLSWNLFHHDVGLNHEIPSGDELGNMQADKARQDHLLHLKADDCGWVSPLVKNWHLHQHG